MTEHCALNHIKTWRDAEPARVLVEERTVDRKGC